MTPEALIGFSTFFPWGFLKLGILVLLGIYIVFAAVIVRQEQLMSKIVEVPFSPVLRLVSIVHLIASIGVFFIALFFL